MYNLYWKIKYYVSVKVLGKEQNLQFLHIQL